jgi:hypothetical protein
MEDSEFHALRLRASICPSMETGWDKPETSHWIALHKAANEMRGMVSKNLAALDAVERDKALSPEGKKTKKQEIIEQALDALKKPASLTKAREAVETQLQKWQDAVAANLKPPADAAEVQIHAEIRERVGGMKEARDRMSFLQKNAGAPTITAALLSAPVFLSNLSESELALLRYETEKKYLGQEVVESKQKTEKALAEVERSLRAAQAMIRKNAAPAMAAAPARVA